MKVITYTRADGGISIVSLSRRALSALVSEKVTEEQAAAILQQKVVPTNATDVQHCDQSQIPTDRRYRDAWESDLSGSGNPITVNMTKARAIHRDRLRAARPSRFAELDAKWMKAVATNDGTEATRCEAQRQTLRDLPQNPAIDAAATPEELMALWPAELPAL